MTSRHNRQDEWINFILECPLKWSLVFWTFYVFWPVETTVGNRQTLPVVIQMIRALLQ